MTALRIIKKYPNRRLYDTEISSYITIEDVRQLVIDGDTFEVRDARSGEDLTRCVLLQIIAEHEQQSAPILSTEMLAQIVRAYGGAVQVPLGAFLDRSMQLFAEQQRELHRLLAQTTSPGSTLSVQQLAERNLAQWKEFQQRMLAAFQAEQRAAPAANCAPTVRPLAARGAR
jgi:polyhydroxyalkanoate synthesis repressor PhaR